MFYTSMKKPVKKGGRKIKKKPVVISSLVIICCISFLSIAALLWPKFDTPSVSHITVVEGMRKEEVAEAFAKALNWSDKDKQKFIAISPEGFTFPTTYDIPITSKPEEVTNAILTTFTTEVIDKNPKLKATSTDLHTIIKIASILEREAYGKRDIKIISGIIWNRLNNKMSLDMDATLQYAKGSSTRWWPIVTSEDKSIDSPFNTYKNLGLPPSPISNPGPVAIDAALNPTKTNALFYIHDHAGYIHTAETYEQHKANIDLYLR